MLRKESFFLLLAGLSSFLFALGGSVVSIIRYWQYEVFYFDFGVFDKALFMASRFMVPMIDHYIFGEKIIFADHFSPTLFLLSPIYWIVPFSEALLVLQAVFVALGGFFLFLLGREVMRNGFYAFCILLCYFLFTGLQNAIITDFHEATIATCVFIITLYGIAKKKMLLFSVSFFLLLGLKESYFLLGIGISCALFFLTPTHRRMALFLCCFALLYGIIVIKGVIPFFSHDGYFYSSDIPLNPVTIAKSFVDSPIKRTTLLFTYGNFGLLPLLSPAFYLLQFQDLLTRFYPQMMVTRWGLGFHYSAVTTAIMAVSSIYSLAFLQKRVSQKILTIFVILLVCNSLILYRFILHGPFALLYNKAFYTHTADFTFLRRAMTNIPKDTSIITQNNLASHFSHQRVWLMLSDNKRYPKEYYTLKKPEYILLDFHDGQNPNNFFGIKDTSVLLHNLEGDPTYKKIYSENKLVIYKRKQ